MFVRNKCFSTTCCFVIINLLFCTGSPIGTVTVPSDLSLPRPNTTPPTISAQNNSSLVRPVQPSRQWPSIITLDENHGVYLTLDSIRRLTDPAQIKDIDSSLALLRSTICRPGHNPSSVFESHTYTTLLLGCPFVGLPLLYQRHYLDLAIAQISYGQSVYGPAAVGFSIFGSLGIGREDIEFGGLEVDVTKDVPPRAKSAWPSESLTISVAGMGTQGHRLRILSRGPTLDNWDRTWYMGLLILAQKRIEIEGRLRDPVGAVRVEVPTHGLEFSLRPLVKGEERPSRGMLANVLAAISDKVIQPFGARELEFQWVDGGRKHLGVGYLESIEGGDVGMEPVVMSGNRTGLLTDVRGINGTGPLLDFRGSNTTVNSESVATA